MQHVEILFLFVWFCNAVLNSASNREIICIWVTPTRVSWFLTHGVTVKDMSTVKACEFTPNYFYDPF